MTRLLPDVRPPAVPLSPHTDAPAVGAARGPRQSGLTREALARHGGMAPTEAGAASLRPATTNIARAAARTARNAFRPLSLNTAAAPKAPDAPQRARGADAPGPSSLAQAKQAWLQAASSFPLAKSVLQPQQALGSLNAADTNVVAEHLRLLEVPEAGEKWLVTVADPRTESSSKRRRWAISDNGTLACCLEFLPFHERNRDEAQLAADSKRRLSPDEANERAAELAEFEAEVVQEVHTAALYNRDMEVHAFFRTADNRLVVIMTDFPEEVSYLSNQLPGAQRQAMAYRLFGEVSARLHRDLHGKGLVHGDLKPSNIMMTTAGKFTLIDFEATRLVGSDGLVSVDDCLEATFAPPEYHLRQQMGKAGDMWALGVSMVHLFAFGEMNDKIAAPAARVREAYAEAEALDEQADAARAQGGGARLRELSRAREQALSRARTAEQQVASIEQPFYELWGKFSHLLGQRDFERVRQQLAAAPDPLATLRQLILTRPYLQVLQPFAEATPEIFALSMRSLLAIAPALRKDAAEARALGEQLLKTHGAAIAANAEAERQVLAASASQGLVFPQLTEVAQEEQFLRG